MIEIRDMRPSDRAAVRALLLAAFAQAEEADLVEALRAEGAVLSEAVACDGGAVVGHVLFSRLPIESGQGVTEAAALAPLAVLPERQRQGIGARLVAAGLETCRAQGLAAVIVLGDPAYYRRFGFAAELAKGLEAPFKGEAFMGLELKPGALAGGGRVRYAAAFGLDEGSQG